MRKPTDIKINATKVKGVGDLPTFIHLGHRHLQKEKSDGKPGDGQGVREFTLPLDLIRMTVAPALLADIEEVTLGYKKG